MHNGSNQGYPFRSETPQGNKNLLPYERNNLGKADNKSAEGRTGKEESPKKVGEVLNRVCFFAGQKFIHSSPDNILHFHLREPFLTAGKQFGWGMPRIGLGINKQALEYAVKWECRIQVTVRKNKNAYRIKAEAWLEFAKKYNASMIRGETTLLHVQWTTEHFQTVPKDEVDKELEKGVS